jgi:hypothetical protein
LRLAKDLCISICIIAFVGIFFTTSVEAEQWEKTSEGSEISGVTIPENEFAGYFDYDREYTVVGVIKNREQYPIIPTVIINVKDGQEIISKTLEYVPILPSKDLPFKIKIPEVKDLNPTLMEPEISFVFTQKDPLNVEVIYDETLVKYDDNHLTGRIINKGNQTIYNIKVFALVHGLKYETLDTAQNIEFIEKLDPGQIHSFTLYPDPAVSAEAHYYSCFAITDSFVRPLSTERNEKKFYFRYDSGSSWYTAPLFNEDGTELYMRTQNSFPLETYANFEFPKFSDDEKFDVFVNGEPKKSIQSIDEFGNWHVAFNVGARESGEIVISGFKEGWDPGDRIFIPDWIKTNAQWWYQGQVNDETFIKGIEFMIKEEIIKTTASKETQKEKSTIPAWIKINAGWWAEEKIPDETFVNGLEFLIKNGIIQI